MDINVQLFTGSCETPADLNVRDIMGKLNKILEKAHITNALIGWNKDADMSEIVSMLKSGGADVYLWLPIFSELDSLADFSPLIGRGDKEILINYDAGNDEKFRFYCPADEGNVEKAIEIFEKHYSDGLYDGVFLDKIRFPSFMGGAESVLGCYCDYCRSNYDLPELSELRAISAVNPFGITAYRDLGYEMDGVFKKLFDYKCDAVFDSLKRLCGYFRGKGLKIGMDLFAPFLAYYVGQDYHRLMPLADIVKPMFYRLTNAPAGLPFEIEMYAGAFDDDIENVFKRQKLFTEIVGYGGVGFINSEIAGIRKIIDDNGLKTKLYAGVEFNYNSRIAPVTREYIEECVSKIENSDGIVLSWDLNTTPDRHIDYLLNILGVM